MSKYHKLFRVTYEGHWEWTGYITPPKQRRKIRYEPEKYNKVVDLGSHYEYQSKGEARASFKGRSVSANKAVIADHLGVDISEIKSIRRTCTNDRCVNPDHYLVYRTALPQMVANVQHPVTLEMLIENDSDPAMGPMGAEIDLNLATGSIPNELWIEYLAATEGAQDAPDA